MALRDHVHIVPRYGDVLITIGLIKWKGWDFLRQSVFDRTIRIWAFIFMLLGSLIALIIELFAYPIRAILRIRAGKLGMGFIITVLSLWNISLFSRNPSMEGYWQFISESVSLVYKLIFYSDYSDLNASEIIGALFQPESNSMRIFFYLFAASAAIRLIAMYLIGWRNENTWSKGVSAIYLGTKNYFRLGRSFWEVLYEPALVIVIGWLFQTYAGDFRMALFLYIAAGSLFLQEVTDYLVRISYEK